jgi:hypothetical protein
MKASRVILVLMFVIALIAVPLALYATAYFWLGEENRTSSMHDAYIEGKRVWMDDGLTIERSYSRQWQAKLFEPAGNVESWVRNVNVEITSPDAR